MTSYVQGRGERNLDHAWREGDRVVWKEEPTHGTIKAVGPHNVRVAWDDGIENSVRCDDPSLKYAPKPTGKARRK